MFRSLKRWLGSEKGQRTSDPTSVNNELLQAIALRNQAESPQTLRAFYDAFAASTLLVALPPDQRKIANTFVDSLRRGDEFTLIGQSDGGKNAIWYIFTDEAALRRWAVPSILGAPVPALDILWTAAKNHITIAINPADGYPTEVHLTHEEIQTLSEGRYPTAAQCANFLSGTRIQVLPLNEPPSEALQKALRRTLRHKSAIVNAYIFNAEFGYQGSYRCLGLEFDPQVDDRTKKEICVRLPHAGPIPPSDAAQLAILPLWDEILADVLQHGVNVYSREHTGSHRYGVIPEERELRIGRPSPVAGVWKLASGVWLIDFGPDTLDDPAFWHAVRISFEQDSTSPVVWILQGSAIASFPLEPASLQRWLRTLYQLRQIRTAWTEEAKDCFIVDAASSSQKAFLQVLATLGVVLQPPGQNDELFVEIHYSQGVTMTFPGVQSIQLAPENCVVLQANIEKDHLAATGDPRVAKVEAEERNAIAWILEKSLTPGQK